LAKSAYAAFFQGTIAFHPWERIWKSWAPGKCHFFIWLLEIELEADRLARRGLQHSTTCPHCDQDEENINHLLLSCVFAREFWFSLLQRVGLQHLCPQMEDVCFDDWWDRISSGAVDLIQKVLIPLLF
jgi:hypothetical protein